MGIREHRQAVLDLHGIVDDEMCPRVFYRVRMADGTIGETQPMNGNELIAEADIARATGTQLRELERGMRICCERGVAPEDIIDMLYRILGDVVAGANL